MDLLDELFRRFISGSMHHRLSVLGSAYIRGIVQQIIELPAEIALAPRRNLYTQVEET